MHLVAPSARQGSFIGFSQFERILNWSEHVFRYSHAFYIHVCCQVHGRQGAKSKLFFFLWIDARVLDCLLTWKKSILSSLLFPSIPFFLQPMDHVLVDGRPLHELKVTELKDELGKRFLSKTGNKLQLSNRLGEVTLMFLSSLFWRKKIVE